MRRGGIHWTRRVPRLAGWRRGTTLLEMLIFAAIWAMVTLSTLRVLADSRRTRAAARDKAAMVLIAQSALDRARVSPATTLAAGSRDIARTDDWPLGVTAVLNQERRTDGTWLAEVVVSKRDTLDQRPDVRLATIRPGTNR